jgi:Transposase IS116/IS110/IS902 family./Transposase.
MAREQRRRQALRVLNRNAAGIDIGSNEHWVAVPPDRDPEPVRRFAAFTADLVALADWLRQCGVTSVVMEATGVYWIPLFQILETRGFEVKLVNAKHVRHVPGRKSDQRDCQWLQELHSYGLLSASFRPENDICVLRAYLRHRDNVIRAAAQQVQLMQKSLIQMNVLLHNVISDITGLTGRKILDDILRGERDPMVLAAHRHPRIRATSEEIARSLHGDYREEHLFTLRQAVESYDFFGRQLRECDESILKVLRRFEPKLPPEAMPPASTSSHHKPQRNEPPVEFGGILYRLLGVDLTQVPGVQTSTAITIVSEIGLDISKFRSEKQFSSWLGVSPSPKVSGGKRLGEERRRIRNRVAQALRIAATSLQRSPTALGAFFRRMRFRLGPAKAIKATAHKLARILYRLLRYGTAYVETGQQAYEEQFRARQLKGLQRRAQDLGFTLVPRPEGGLVS